MKIEGRLISGDDGWSAEVPLLLVHTQGASKNIACAMVKDAIEMLVDHPGFAVTVTTYADNTFSVAANDETALLAFVLRQQRGLRGLTVRQIAERLGSKSPTAYSQYESGKVKPTLDKFTRLLKAIDPDLDPILKVHIPG